MPTPTLAIDGVQEQWGSQKISSTAEGGTTGERKFLTTLAQRCSHLVPKVNQEWLARPGVKLYASDIEELPYGASGPLGSGQLATHVMQTWAYKDRPRLLVYPGFWDVTMQPVFQMLDIGEGRKFLSGTPVPAGNAIPVPAVEITVVGDQLISAWGGGTTPPDFASSLASIPGTTQSLLGKVCSQKYLGPANPREQLLFENEVYDLPRFVVNGFVNNDGGIFGDGWVRRFTRTFLWRLVMNDPAASATWGGHNWLWNPVTRKWEVLADPIYPSADMRTVFPFRPESLLP